MSAHIPIATARKVRERAGNACEYCKLPQSSQEAAFHIDHILPRVRGGETKLANLALACVTCSLRKGARVRVPDVKAGRPIHLVHPRRDVWKDHFRWTRGWRLAGRTLTGRVTVTALGINRPALVAIRKTLVLLGRFPSESLQEKSI